MCPEQWITLVEVFTSNESYWPYFNYPTILFIDLLQCYPKDFRFPLGDRVFCLAVSKTKAPALTPAQLSNCSGVYYSAQARYYYHWNIQEYNSLITHDRQSVQLKNARIWNVKWSLMVMTVIYRQTFSFGGLLTWQSMTARRDCDGRPDSDAMDNTYIQHLYKTTNRGVKQTSWITLRL